MRKHAFAGQNTQQWANDGCKYCTNVRRLLKSITGNYYQLLQNNYYCYVQHWFYLMRESNQSKSDDKEND